MAKFNQAFKVQCVKKVLSKRSDQTVKDIADQLGVGYSTLQKWIRFKKGTDLFLKINLSPFSFFGSPPAKPGVYFN